MNIFYRMICVLNALDYKVQKLFFNYLKSLRKCENYKLRNVQMISSTKVHKCA